jgi:hypothetical protein
MTSIEDQNEWSVSQESQESAGRTGRIINGEILGYLTGLRHVSFRHVYWMIDARVEIREAPMKTEAPAGSRRYQSRPE